MVSTFLVIYPDPIFKKLGGKNVGLPMVVSVFQLVFGSNTVFVGTAEFSACDALKKQPSDNLATYQESIDATFPRDQSLHDQSHAIFSVIIRRGYYRAIGFLNNIMPFYKLFTIVGLSAMEAWGNKMLTFTMSIFEITHQVRTITLEGAAHTMLFGITKATKLSDK